eukprot:g1458.t1
MLNSTNMKKKMPALKKRRKLIRDTPTWLSMFAFFFVVALYVGAKSAGSHSQVSMRRLRRQENASHSRRMFEEEPVSDLTIAGGDVCNPDLDSYNADLCCVTSHDTCELAKAHCPLGTNGSQLINYFELYYCFFDGIPEIGLVVIGGWVLTVFSLLASTADNFFVPMLETLSSELKLSPATAGITLLAFGNCAPDIFADLALVAANDFAGALGELLGAALFLTTVVLGFVILVSTSSTEASVEVDKWTFLRDVGAFMTAIVIIFIIVTTGDSMSTFEGLLIISCYVIYVTTVIVSQRFTSNSSEEENSLDTALLDEENNSSDADSQQRFHAESSSDMHRMRSMFLDDVVQRMSNPGTRWIRGQSNASNPARRPSEYMNSSERRASRAISFATNISGASNDDDENHALGGIDWESDMNLVGKIFWILEFPFSVLRWLSIAPSDGVWDRRRRLLAVFAPIGAVCVVFLDFGHNWSDNPDIAWASFTQIGYFGIPVVALPLFLALIFGIFVYCKTDDENLPNFYLFLMLIAFITTIAWLDMIGNECVALLEFFGSVTGVSSTPSGRTLMGITVLAWANSIGDLVADTAVARAGQPKMGIASTFGAPLLTACLGVGLSSVVGSLLSSTGSVPTEVNAEVHTSYVFVAISLLSSIIVIPCCGFKLPRMYAYYLFLIYTLYMVCVGMILLKGW